jgi:uncharacterized protein YcaQ
MLDAERPTDLVALVEHLTLLQIDPTAAIAPSADLVAWSRLGSAYRPEHLRQVAGGCRRNTRSARFVAWPSNCAWPMCT